MTAPLLVVASSGGMMRVKTASDIPVFAVGSGPAGGVMGAARLGQANGNAMRSHSIWVEQPPRHLS